MQYQIHSFAPSDLDQHTQQKCAYIFEIVTVVK